MLRRDKAQWRMRLRLVGILWFLLIPQSFVAHPSVHRHNAINLQVIAGPIAADNRDDLADLLTPGDDARPYDYDMGRMQRATAHHPIAQVSDSRVDDVWAKRPNCERHEIIWILADIPATLHLLD